MRSRGKNRKPMFGRDRRHDLPQAAKLRTRVRKAEVWRGRDLDLRLQEFAGHEAVGRFVSGHKKFFWHPTRDTFGLRVDQEIFFFDPEPEVVHHSSPLVDVRPRDASPSVTWAKLLRERG